MIPLTGIPIIDCRMEDLLYLLSSIETSICGLEPVAYMVEVPPRIWYHPWSVTQVASFSKHFALLAMSSLC